MIPLGLIMTSLNGSLKVQKIKNPQKRTTPSIPKCQNIGVRNRMQIRIAATVQTNIIELIIVTIFVDPLAIFILTLEIWKFYPLGK
jgi:hypothetical protein